MKRSGKAAKPRWKPARLQDVRHVPVNPWRGMYSICPFVISGCPVQRTLPPVRKEHSLCLVELNLVAFRDDMLSDAALTEIDCIFAHYRDNRQDMIVRFVYDLEGNGLQNEPEEMNTILTHIRQLGPLLRQYADSIYTLQGLLVGSWGEMHTSRHLDTYSLITLTHALDEAAGGTLLLSVRCPNQWRSIFQTYDPPQSGHLFDGSLRARTGLFNDAVLASETDFGTYGQVSRAQASRSSIKLNREEELAFQDRLCRGVPNGGELVQGDHSFTMTETYRTFSLMHLSYLNADFDLKALDRLKARRSIAKDRCFPDASAYEYLTGHLGYRYRVCKTQVTADADGITLQVQLQNNGFAPCYFPLEPTVILKTDAQSQGTRIPLSGDLRQIAQDEKQWLTAHITPDQLSAAAYRVELTVHDPRSKRPVYLASAAKGETAAATLLLGTLKLRH